MNINERFRSAGIFVLLNIQKMIGNINKVRTVAVINPPIITIAKGFCDSEPIPVDKAAGINPMDAIKAVMITGRVLDFTPVKWHCQDVIRFLRSDEIP